MMRPEDDRMPLETLDPGSWEPGYWHRFQRDVMQRAGAELARRRAAATVTIGEVVQSWARLLVPTMAAAAITAALLLAMEPRTEPVGTPSEMEAFAGGIEGDRIPAVLDEAAGSATFAAQEF